MRISCPPTMSPCFYGVDTPTKKELIASSHTVEEICKYIEADSLAYLSLPGLLRAVEAKDNEFCTACYTGKYPLDFVDMMPDAKEAERQLDLWEAVSERSTMTNGQSPTKTPASTSTTPMPPKKRIRGSRARNLHARGAVRYRQLRRNVRLQLCGHEEPGSGLEHGWRRHQAESRGDDEPPQHGRRRSRQSLRQRHPGSGRAAAVLHGLRRDRQARSRRHRFRRRRASPAAARKPVAR